MQKKGSAYLILFVAIALAVIILAVVVKFQVDKTTDSKPLLAPSEGSAASGSSGGPGLGKVFIIIKDKVNNAVKGAIVSLDFYYADRDEIDVSKHIEGITNDNGAVSFDNPGGVDVNGDPIGLKFNIKACDPNGENCIEVSGMPQIAETIQLTLAGYSIPIAQPSTAPSTGPSTPQSNTPTTSPSTEPNTVPSIGPSTTPSTEPSTLPSTEPSTPPIADLTSNVGELTDALYSLYLKKEIENYPANLNYQVKFSLPGESNGEVHSIALYGLNENNDPNKVLAELWIASDRVNFTLNKSEEREFDLNGDTKADVSVNLTSIDTNDKSAKVYLKALSGGVINDRGTNIGGGNTGGGTTRPIEPADDNPNTGQNGEDNQNNSGQVGTSGGNESSKGIFDNKKIKENLFNNIWIIVGLIVLCLVILAVIIFIIIRSKKHRGQVLDEKPKEKIDAITMLNPDDSSMWDLLERGKASLNEGQIEEARKIYSKLVTLFGSRMAEGQLYEEIMNFYKNILAVS